MSASSAKNLPDKRYFRIGEVCELTGLKPHVLRYWETEFKQIKPIKTKTSQRLYRKKDVETILLVKHLLYDQKFTISGAREKLEEKRKLSDFPPASRQLAMDFDPQDREEILQTVIAELMKLKQLLDNPPEEP